MLCNTVPTLRIDATKTYADLRRAPLSLISLTCYRHVTPRSLSLAVAPYADTPLLRMKTEDDGTLPLPLDDVIPCRAARLVKVDIESRSQHNASLDGVNSHTMVRHNSPSVGSPHTLGSQTLRCSISQRSTARAGKESNYTSRTISTLVRSGAIIKQS